MNIRRMAPIVVSLVLLAACSSSKGASGTPTSASNGGTGATTATQPPATAAGGAVTIASNTPLASGTKYAIANTILQASIGFTATDVSKQAFVTPGFIGVAADANGAEPVAAFLDLANSRVFRDPHVDFTTFANAGDVINATDPAPDDFVGFVGKLPGMTVGTPSETTFLGVPATSVTYKVDSVDGGFQCGKDNPAPCLLVLFVTTGPTIALHKGDAGTLYLLKVSGRRLLVEVSDHAGAADFIKGVTFAAS